MERNLKSDALRRSSVCCKCDALTTKLHQVQHGSRAGFTLVSVFTSTGSTGSPDSSAADTQRFCFCFCLMLEHNAAIQLHSAQSREEGSTKISKHEPFICLLSCLSHVPRTAVTRESVISCPAALHSKRSTEVTEICTLLKFLSFR